MNSSSKSPTKASAPKRPRRTKADSVELDKIAQEADFLSREWDEEASLKPLQQPGRLSRAPEDDLGLRLQEGRKAKFLTQGDLANLTKSLDSDEKGISRAVLSLYEAGTNRPSPREIRLLCEALQITPNFLIYGDEVPFHESNDYHRLGTIARKTPEGYAWMAYIMATAHHNHYDAVMKLLLDLARGWNKNFDQGMQDRANQLLVEMADGLKQRLQDRKATADPKK